MSLNVREKRVMRAVLSFCKKTDGCLVTPEALLQKTASPDPAFKKKNDKKDISREELEKILRVLELDDYFELIPGLKRGETVYCINLHAKGAAFEREVQRERRAFWGGLAVKILFAIVTFVVGRILIKLFT